MLVRLRKMTAAEIPYDRWAPLSVEEVVATFANAPFQWCLAGGYAIEQFFGSSIRPHSDIDITVYRDEQLSVQRWLKGWELYAADPSQTLRKWCADEFLPFGSHDIWGHQVESDAWQLQIMLAEVEGDEWFSRRSPMIRGQRMGLMTVYGGIPCIRVEIQLMYKAKNPRPKDEQDFLACLPRMSAEARDWLREKLMLLYPQGHDWLDFL
jgi:hypothetical protein